ncbi:WD40 repeat-like protein [Rhizoclosmatium globosum]|uniref:WD40 repeat-like protein n=1 Tax=Rhizoclosmatium globosum TaxID=329046 RepID=A0A1Y2BVG8_9FUNG|nr:WD40 repeat-like protein [Rhizoclosmatium globosum]|eukprot:ORY38759.1 WD40 repeat-like protein [Rhizoclosmatium globosum]
MATTVLSPSSTIASTPSPSAGYPKLSTEDSKDFIPRKPFTFSSANPPPSNSWRQCITLTSKRYKENIYETASVKVPNLEKYTTSVQTLGETPYIAVGCASEENNLFIIENLAPPVLNQFEPAPEGSGLKTRSAFTAPDAIFKMTFSGDRLLTAGSNSRLQMFKIDLNEIGTRGKGLEHLFECKLNSGKLDDVKVAPPGTRVASVRVHDVDFMPCEAGMPSPKFVAAVGRRLFLWDIEAQKVSASEMVSYDQVMSASWSPHLPYGSLLATSGVDHHISVLDARLMGNDSDKSVVWKVERAHGGHNHPSITAVEFNPFVPYWLASAGEDSIVRVWDLRYLKNPTAKIEGHYQGIQSMTWSNTHAEILVTGSSDCSFRAWCLDSQLITPTKSSRTLFIGSPATEWTSTTTSPQQQDQPHQPPLCITAKMLLDISHTFTSPVVTIAASPTHLNTFYAVSATAEMSAITLRPDLFHATSPHRFSAVECPLESRIEACVYARELGNACTGVVELSRTAMVERRSVGRYEKKMIDLCTPRDGISPGEWAVAGQGGKSLVGSLRKVIGPWREEGKEGGKEMVERFRIDLDTVSYFLPPGFGDRKRWIDLIPPKTKLDFQMVSTRHNILLDVGKKNWEAVFSAQETITTSITTDPTFHTPDFLHLLTESLLPIDFPRALSFSTTLMKAVARHTTWFGEVAGMLGLLLFPTVFEGATWITEPSNLERRWSEGRGGKMRGVWVRGFLEEKAGGAGGEKEKEKVGKKEEGGGKASKRRGAELVQENEDRKKQSAVEALMGDSDAVLSMLSTEIKILKTLAKQQSNEEIAETIIEIVTGQDSDSSDTSTNNQEESKLGTTSMIPGIKHAYRPTISVTTNRLYLDSLLLTKRFEEYWILSAEFCTTYQQYEFPKSVMRHMETLGIPRIKSHIEGLHAKSMGVVEEVVGMMEKGSVTSVVGPVLVSGSKWVREGLVVVVRGAVVLAGLIEAKGVLEKEGVEIIARCVGGVGAMVSLLSGSIFKILEQMEKMFGKLGTAGAFARDVASLTLEEIRQICRGYSKPSEAKTRATAAIVSAATGANTRDSGSGAALMEEVFSIQERLSKLSKAPV